MTKENLQNGNRGPTWRIIASVMGAILLLALGWFGNYTHSEIKDLREKKVDKEQYNCDIREIKEGIAKLVNMHLKEN